LSYLNISWIPTSNYFTGNNFLSSPHIAASRISFLRSYFENMNLEVPHQMVFLDETWVYANGSELKMWSDGTSQSDSKKVILICDIKVLE
jgi:hypothetical protein